MRERDGQTDREREREEERKNEINKSLISLDLLPPESKFSEPASSIGPRSSQLVRRGKFGRVLPAGRMDGRGKKNGKD